VACPVRANATAEIHRYRARQMERPEGSVDKK